MNTVYAPPLRDDLDTALRRPRLPHVRRHTPEVLAIAKDELWEPAEVLPALLTAEADGRDRTELATRRARAGFLTGRTFDAWDPAVSTILGATQQALEWVHSRDHLVVAGPAGTGETFLLEALGHAAVEQGLHIAWFTLEDLGVLVRIHHADDTVTKAVEKILRAGIVVVSDIGLLPVGPEATEGPYCLVDAAYEKRINAISSNMHPAGLEEIMPETLAPATVLGTSPWPITQGVVDV